MTHRVVQWTTGNVGLEAVKLIAANPGLELIGCYAWSQSKVGVDVGELVGMAPLGVTATDDVDALLALEPDVVSYSAMWFDVDDVVRILESGANIVTTAGFLTGHSLGEEVRQRVMAACERGNSTIFGTGLNPGFANLVALVMASGSSRIDKVAVRESFEISGYDSPATELPVGFDQPPDNPELPAMVREGTKVFIDAVTIMGDALGVEFDEIVCEPEFAVATEDVVMDSWTIARGRVAGIAASWQGRVGGRTIVDLRFIWAKGMNLDPAWEVDHSYTITVTGLPSFQARYTPLPPKDFAGTTLKDFMTIGMVTTAVSALNAIPDVVSAPAGILTYADRALPLPRGLVQL